MHPRYLVTILVLLAVMLPPSSVHAAGVVTICDEAHLRAALAGGGTVTFGCSGTIVLTSQIVIASDTTLDGTGQNITISGNHTVRVFYVNSGVTLMNTLVAANPTGSNCYGPITDGSGNLSCPDTTCPGIDADPKLGPLQNNGGPTQTMALLPGSAALDAGNDAICAAYPVNNLDHRGVTRPQGAHCDIGAYEAVQAPPPTPTPTATPICSQDPYEPNGTFEQAWGPLSFNQDLWGYFVCASDSDRDFYDFDLATRRRVIIRLENIPTGSDYDLTLYDCADSTCLIQHSGNHGNTNERIDITADARRYYVRVTRGSSPLSTQPYRLRVEIP